MKAWNLIALLTVALEALCSCRSIILEDRKECPAYVFFQNTPDNPADKSQPMLVTVRDAGSMEELASDNPLLREIVDPGYYLSIQKRPEIIVCGVAGVQTNSLSGTRLEIPSGGQGDPIYRFCSKETLSGEFVRVPLTMTKEFCRVLVRFRSEDGVFPYSVVVRANTCGMDIATGEPLEGVFRHAPMELSTGVFMFTVPRQADYSLSLQLWDYAQSKGGEEDCIEDFLLWNALRRIDGFSWGMKNLPDLTVEIDYVNASVSVLVNDWDLSETINYSI